VGGGCGLAPRRSVTGIENDRRQGRRRRLGATLVSPSDSPSVNLDSRAPNQSSSHRGQQRPEQATRGHMVSRRRSAGANCRLCRSSGERGNSPAAQHRRSSQHVLGPGASGLGNGIMKACQSCTSRWNSDRQLLTNTGASVEALWADKTRLPDRTKVQCAAQNAQPTWSVINVTDRRDSDYSKTSVSIPTLDNVANCCHRCSGPGIRRWID
jgi:hypothetical protein